MVLRLELILIFVRINGVDLDMEKDMKKNLEMHMQKHMRQGMEKEN